MRMPIICRCQTYGYAWHLHVSLFFRSDPKKGKPGISISKLALENGINANLLFKWRQQWRDGKLLLPSSESPQLLPVTLDATAVQPESLAEDPGLSISCEVTFRHGTLRLNGTVSETFLALLIQELKR
ncbi:transposase [Salmonella enterica]|nr:transposase [Salmonella enterica]